MTEDERGRAARGVAIANGPLFTRGFVLVCLATAAFFGSFYLLVPILPIYVIDLGGSQADVGLAVGAFSFTALLLRPFVGREVDRLGRKRFIVGGALIFLVSSLFYNLATSVPLLVLLRIFHGTGIACFTTASSTYVADIVPVNRRGEAMGYFGMSNTVALALGPAAGMALMGWNSFPLLFLASTGVALVAVAMAGQLPERVSPVVGMPKRGPLLHRDVLFPSAILACLTATYGAIMTFLPLLAIERGIDRGGVGLFFTLYAVVLLVARSFTGTLSDRFGRPAAIVPGMVAAALAISLVAVADSLPLLLAAGVVYGFAFAAVHPALMALVVDRTDPKTRGSAMATFSAAFDLGIGAGSMLWGATLGFLGFRLVYLSAAGVALAGLAGFVIGQRAKAQP